MLPAPSPSLAYAAVLDDTGARLFVPRHALGASTQASVYGYGGDWFGRGTVDALSLVDDAAVTPTRAAPPMVAPRSSTMESPRKVGHTAAIAGRSMPGSVRRQKRATGLVNVC